MDKTFFGGLAGISNKLAADPNNGTLGLWHVRGARHNAIVRASSAPEAAKKALEVEAVGDWEMLDVEFLGVEMPDIYRY